LLSSLISLGVTFCSSVNYSFILTEYISYLDRTIVLIALLGCSHEDSILPIVIGVIKPVVGAGFGVLVFAIIASQILPISLGHTNDQKRQDLRWLSFVAITFVAGFSERLVKDIISQTEEQFVTTKIDGRTQMLLSTTEDEEVS
jgi:hypothetical protein